MSFTKTELYHQPGTGWHPVVHLEGGHGRDFAFKIYRRSWDDRRIQRFSCAASNPTGDATNLFFHVDVPILTFLDTDGACSAEILADTVRLVVYDVVSNNVEWKNKRSLIEFLCSHFGIPDSGAEFAGPKSLDLVYLDGPIHLHTFEKQRVETKATWNDFEFLLVFDFPHLLIEIREIHPRYRAPILRYLTDPSNVVPREPDGAVIAPKVVIEKTIQALAASLAAFQPTVSLSQRTLRLTSTNRLAEAVLKWLPDRNNKAGVRVGAGLSIELRETRHPSRPTPRQFDYSRAGRDLLMTQNANAPWEYELSRYQQREIIVQNLAAYVECELAPKLESVSRTETRMGKR